MQELLLPLFASDLARDVRAEYDEKRAVGLDVVDATRAVVAAFGEVLARHDEGPVVIFALAALQLHDGALNPGLRDAALDLLREGYGFLARPGEALADRHQREALRQAFIAALECAPTTAPGDAGSDDDRHSQ